MHQDERGRFHVVAHRAVLQQELGADFDIAQVNLIEARPHAARGLHYNVTGRQGKYLFVLTGGHYVVTVDVRKDSARPGAWEGRWLRWGEKLWVPPGNALGVMTGIGGGSLLYVSTIPYDAAQERSLALDCDLCIQWPIRVDDMLTVPRDRAVKTLAEFWSSYD